MPRATALAPSNIALVKYWGKRDELLNLPAAGSISVTLDALTTTTTVAFDEARDEDEIRFEGAALHDGVERIARFLDMLRARFDVRAHAQVVTRNDFPTGAGLASSASGFAALTLACDAALGLGLPREALSALARRGSGSAARSLVAGFAEMQAGRAEDGSDAYAVPLAAPDHVPLAVLVALTTAEPKAVGSSEGMRRTAATSPYYDGWLEAVRQDLAAMREAVRDADLERIGEMAERSALRMHGAMLGAEPPLLYWNAGTLAVLDAVRALRRAGTGAWCTIDAGPQVKVLCHADDADAVGRRLVTIDGVQDVVRAAPGAGARLVSHEG